MRASASPGRNKTTEERADVAGNQAFAMGRLTIDAAPFPALLA